TCGGRPRAAVVTTGTELRPPGEPLSPGQIYESNGPMLEAQLRAAGADVERLPPVEDDPDAHRRALERALEADLVVTSGGVSVGPHDLVRRVEADLGVEEVFWRVAVKPGKPISFGVRGAGGGAEWRRRARGGRGSQVPAARGLAARRERLPRRVGWPDARDDPHRRRVGEVAVRREEPRVAGLEDDHLAPVRVEHREVV